MDLNLYMMNVNYRKGYHDGAEDAMKKPEWCKIGVWFDWEAESITGCKKTEERIIGYTDDGFLHTAHNCPVYETKFDNLKSGKLIVNP